MRGQSCFPGPDEQCELINVRSVKADTVSKGVVWAGLSSQLAWLVLQKGTTHCCQVSGGAAGSGAAEIETVTRSFGRN